MRPIRAIIYARVSTLSQAATGISLADQAEQVRRYCDAQGWVVVGTETDPGISGGTLARPGLQSGLAAIRTGVADLIVALSICRISRSVPLLRSLPLSNFASVQSGRLSSTAQSTLVTTMIGAVGEFQRLHGKERTKSALQVLKGAGVKLGAVPYGWMRLSALDNCGRRRIVESPVEQAVIAEIVSLWQSGQSMRAIARALESRGVVGKRGGKWTAGAVSSVLRRAGCLP